MDYNKDFVILSFIKTFNWRFVLNLKEEIIKLKEELDVTLVAHFYQRDEVFELADITGDSLELAKKAKATDSEFIVFCGVGFMGESVKVMSPQKRVLMPKIACCAMARMIDEGYYEQNLKKINEAWISSFAIPASKS